ncbi:hypothetical protein Y032_0143g2355 [Ancylostoma ceylanicum]|nr:hypothetical protein Y032_0143g2355 [Ancylostoma ceylanicum]
MAFIGSSCRTQMRPSGTNDTVAVKPCSELGGEGEWEVPNSKLQHSQHNPEALLPTWEQLGGGGPCFIEGIHGAQHHHLVVLEFEAMEELRKNNYKRKEAIKLSEYIVLIVGQPFDRPRCVPECQHSRCHGKRTVLLKKIDGLRVRSRSDGAVAQAVYLFEKEYT